jgi:two-component system response regulator TtrR
MTPPESLTLAVVDDDDDVRIALSRLLRAIGHQVSLFASAEEFEAEDMTVDCVIADVRLPGLSGLELRERLRGQKARIPVVLITGDCDRLARDLGTTIDTPLLTKPFDAAVLTQAIASAMSLAVVERKRHAY